MGTRICFNSRSWTTNNNEELYFTLGNGHRYIPREKLMSIRVLNIHSSQIAAEQFNS